MSNNGILQPNVLEEVFKSLDLLNTRLEHNTITSLERSLALIEINHVVGKIIHCPDIANIYTNLQMEQLNSINTKLASLLKLSLAPENKKEGDGEGEFSRMQMQPPAAAPSLPPSPSLSPSLPPPPPSPAPDALEEFVQNPHSAGFVNLCGMDAILKKIQAMFILPLRHPQLFQQQSMCRNLLLFGPPGCGKTQLVYALSVELNAKLYSLTPGNLLSKYVGETEKVVHRVFTELRQRTDVTVLFIDEIDAFCCARSTNEDEHNRRVKIEFMHQMEAEAANSKMIVVAATNMPWDIDSAVVRRFQQQLYLGLPDIQQRSALLEHYMPDADLGGPYKSTQLWAHLLKKTEGYSSCDLKELVRAAMQKPIEELLETATWHFLDGWYVPCSCPSEKKKDCITTVLNDLPPGSVRSRPIEIIDLIMTAGNVQRTVTDQEVDRYRMYLDRSKN